MYILHNDYFILDKIYILYYKVVMYCSGADIMVPGITEVQADFNKGEVVVVRDKIHKKALSVGKALKSSNEIREAKKGKVIKNLHYVGDKLWNTIK